MLTPSLPTINDPEGDRVPENLPTVVDAHVHVFPGPIFSAIRQWFDTHAWHIRYTLSTTGVFEFLLSRGVNHVVALQYAHKPGIARELNRYLAEKCKPFAGRVSGLATVYPGEDDAGDILQTAFDLGLAGMKLHAHVQCFDMTSAAAYELFDVCSRNGKPVVMHVGREPKSPAYPCDPYEICSAKKLERVLRDFPDLRVCVPHLGFDELSAYHRLIEAYDTLWLDTTMALTDYFPIAAPIPLDRYRTDRVMYGSDFPNIPYAWDRELKWLQRAGLSDTILDSVLNRNAADFFGLSTG